MHFQNVINTVAILVTIAMARPRTPGEPRQSFSLESRQDAQGPALCDDFGNNQNCPGQPSLCCLEGSLCILDTNPQGQSTFQCF
ncbi:hypothetical protein BGZ60DRAFT_194826 [Tricladium varicosporioides]|nr:hypothetical protein BGZ60DRAFT_194826 [Hymenoscyphus varicosporioides]